MLINDANQGAIKNFQQEAASVFGSNPLTGTTATTPTADTKVQVLAAAYYSKYFHHSISQEPCIQLSVEAIT